MECHRNSPPFCNNVFPEGIYSSKPLQRKLETFLSPYESFSLPYKETALCYQFIESLNLSDNCSQNLNKPKLCLSTCEKFNEYLSKIGSINANLITCSNLNNIDCFKGTSVELEFDGFYSLDELCTKDKSNPKCIKTKDNTQTTTTKPNTSTTKNSATASASVSIDKNEKSSKKSDNSFPVIIIGIIALILIIGIAIYLYMKKNKNKKEVKNENDDVQAGDPFFLSLSRANEISTKKIAERFEEFEKNTSNMQILEDQLNKGIEGSPFNNPLFRNSFTEMNKDSVPIMEERKIKADSINLYKGDIVSSEESFFTDTYMIVTYNYNPTMDDELLLNVGDRIRIESEYDDGWAAGLNLNTGQYGAFPMVCCKYENDALNELSNSEQGSDVGNNQDNPPRRISSCDYNEVLRRSKIRESLSFDFGSRNSIFNSSSKNPFSNDNNAENESNGNKSPSNKSDNKNSIFNSSNYNPFKNNRINENTSANNNLIKSSSNDSINNNKVSFIQSPMITPPLTENNNNNNDINTKITDINNVKITNKAPFINNTSNTNPFITENSNNSNINITIDKSPSNEDMSTPEDSLLQHQIM